MPNSMHVYLKGMCFLFMLMVTLNYELAYGQTPIQGLNMEVQETINIDIDVNAFFSAQFIMESKHIYMYSIEAAGGMENFNRIYEVQLEKVIGLDITNCNISFPELGSMDRPFVMETSFTIPKLHKVDDGWMINLTQLIGSSMAPQTTMYDYSLTSAN